MEIEISWSGVASSIKILNIEDIEYEKNSVKSGKTFSCYNIESFEIYAKEDAK